MRNNKHQVVQNVDLSGEAIILGIFLLVAGSCVNDGLESIAKAIDDKAINSSPKPLPGN